MKAFQSFALGIVALVLSAQTMISAAAAQQITVYSAGTIAVGENRKLMAYVQLSPNTVNWSVNGIAGGDATVGTVSPDGVYTAPMSVPMPNAVSVKATSTAYPDKSGTGTMTITQPAVQLWSILPTKTAAGSYSIRINGANLSASSVVYAGDQALSTTYKSATEVTARGTASADQVGKKIAITVRNPGLGGTKSSSVQLAITADGGGSTPTDTTPPGIRVSLSPTTAKIALAATQQFTATVTGTTTTTVTYTVNSAVGGNDTVGTISSTGLYRAPAAVQPGTISVGAVSMADSKIAASVAVTLIGPPNPGAGLGTANLAAGRFLEQAAFGPTPADLARVNQLGVAAWLDEQFTMIETEIPMPSSGSMQNGELRAQYLSRMTTAPDQLRQRVANALGQIIVISMNKNNYPNEVVPYMRLLQRHAFGNYRDLLDSITTSSQMGKYLDLANSTKPGASGGANENYPRELMQLFTLGLTTLNADGTPQLDGSGKAIPTYDQTTVQQVALALTGWTFPGPGNSNWENFTGPMKPVDSSHDTRAKAFLGCTLPAGQNTTQDKDATLDCIFKHPNVGPFISLRLIRSLVMSNPSPAYVQRVTQAFNNNGAGVRGDLKAVVRAILTDAEARNDSTVASSGRLKDATYHVASLARALNGRITEANNLSWPLSQMAQMPLAAPSVFSFYSPLYRIPKSTVFGPEFQIYTPTESVLRGNLFWEIISGSGDVTFDRAPFNSVANDTIKLIDAVDQALLYGRMPAAMRQSLANIITSQPDAASRVQVALYMTALSGYYAVQH